MALIVKQWKHKMLRIRDFLAVHWLRRWITSEGGTDSIPGQGTKIPLSFIDPQKKKKKFFLKES